MITNKGDSHNWFQQIKVIVTNDYKFSSNVIEIIRPILNIFFFYEKILHTIKAQNLLCKTQNKKHTKKRSKRLLGQF